ncbi:MAG: hypothetical protein AAGA56_25355, partial [Myxococcota bacterium]
MRMITMWGGLLGMSGVIVQSAACDTADSAPDEAPLAVSVRADLNRQAGRLEPRYFGFAFDTAQFSGGKWWRAGIVERQFAETPDLESPKLRRLTAALG